MRALKPAILGLFVGLTLLPPANARDGYWRHHQGADSRSPGSSDSTFDYYRLALSWSPEFCDTPGGRSPAKRDQCSRSLGFVVHGLWPQYWRGYPESCGPAAHVPTDLAAPALQATPPMPSGDPGFIDHEWSKHGTCSGLAMAEYFRSVKAAAERVKIPAELQVPHFPVDKDFDAIAAMFRASNPGLASDMLEVRVDRLGQVAEVHVCLDKKLDFRPCPAQRRAGGRFLPVR